MSNSAQHVNPILLPQLTLTVPPEDNTAPSYHIRPIITTLASLNAIHHDEIQSLSRSLLLIKYISLVWNHILSDSNEHLTDHALESMMKRVLSETYGRVTETFSEIQTAVSQDTEMSAEESIEALNLMAKVGGIVDHVGRIVSGLRKYQLRLALRTVSNDLAEMGVEELTVEQVPESDLVERSTVA